MEKLESYNLLFCIDIHVTIILYNIYIYKKKLNIIKYVILFNNIIILTYNKIDYYLNPEFKSGFS